MKSKEDLRDVPGYEGIYKASSEGKVMAYAKSWESGRWLLRNHPDKELACFVNRGGYLSTGLRKDGKQKSVTVHRIIALTFIPNPDNKPEINHINGIKTDNRVINLEWATRQENATHAKINDLMPHQCGESHGSAKLTEAEVLQIRASCLSDTKLSKKFNISRGAIYKIKKGIGWKHLS